MLPEVRTSCHGFTRICTDQARKSCSERAECLAASWHRGLAVNYPPAKEPETHDPIVILLPILWVAYRYVVNPLWVTRNFRGHPNFSRKLVIQIDSDGLSKRSAVGQSETKWLAYTKFRETQNLFVLYLGESNRSRSQASTLQCRTRRTP